MRRGVWFSAVQLARAGFADLVRGVLAETGLAPERLEIELTETAVLADRALTALEVDRLGLDSVDRRMLESIITHYGGGPVGLETLAATVGEEAVTLEDVYEPYLMQMGFLTRTPRGRCATKRAYEHLGLTFYGQEQLDL